MDSMHFAKKSVKNDDYYIKQQEARERGKQAVSLCDNINEIKTLLQGLDKKLDVLLNGNTNTIIPKISTKYDNTNTIVPKISTKYDNTNIDNADIVKIKNYIKSENSLFINPDYICQKPFFEQIKKKFGLDYGNFNTKRIILLKKLGYSRISFGDNGNFGINSKKYSIYTANADMTKQDFKELIKHYKRIAMIDNDLDALLQDKGYDGDGSIISFLSYITNRNDKFVNKDYICQKPCFNGNKKWSLKSQKDMLLGAGYSKLTLTIQGTFRVDGKKYNIYVKNKHISTEQLKECIMEYI